MCSRWDFIDPIHTKWKWNWEWTQNESALSSSDSITRHIQSKSMTETNLIQPTLPICCSASAIDIDRSVFFANSDTGHWYEILECECKHYAGSSMASLCLLVTKNSNSKCEKSIGGNDGKWLMQIRCRRRSIWPLLFTRLNLPVGGLNMDYPENR